MKNLAHSTHLPLGMHMLVCILAGFSLARDYSYTVTKHKPVPSLAMNPTHSHHALFD